MMKSSNEKFLDKIIEVIELQRKKINTIFQYIDKDLKEVPRYKTIEPHLKAYLYTRLKYEYTLLAEYEIAKKLLENGIDRRYVWDYLKSIDKIRRYFFHS